MRLAKGDGIADRARRSRDEGRHARRAAARSSTSSTRCSTLEGERYARAAPAARDQEPLRLDRRGRRLRDGARPGLREVADPAALVPRRAEPPARRALVVAASLEGSRPLLVEVQALVAPAGYGTPRRTAMRRRPEPARAADRRARPAGRDRARRPRRLRQLAGGAVASTSRRSTCRWRSRSRRRCRDRPLAPGTVAVGEVGLLGELRPVAGLERRLREAARLGFGRAIVPARGAPGPDARESREGRSDGIGLVPVATLREALAAALLPAPGTGSEARLEPAAAL